MASKPSKRLHMQRLVERNQLSAAEQCRILQTLGNPSRAFLERISKRGTPVKVSALADQLLSRLSDSSKAGPDIESLSAQGPSEAPILDSDLFYRTFLDADEIRTIYQAALPEARRIYYDLLGCPEDPHLALHWCDTADVLGVGCTALANGDLNAASLGLRPDIVERIQNHRDEEKEWHRDRWQNILESRDKTNHVCTS